MSLAAAALLALTALFAQTAVAQATETLVSNSGQTNGGTGSLGTFDQAQAFTTGSNADGYTLTSVDIKFGIVQSSVINYTVTIRESNASNRPGSLVGTLTSPASIAVGLNSFTASASGIDLDKDTTYFIHVDSSSTHGNQLRNTNSNNEDTDGRSDWSIANGSLYRDYDDTSANWQTWHESKSIKIKGIVKGSTTLALVSNTEQTRNSGSSGYLGVGDHNKISTQGFKTGTVYQDYFLASVGVYVHDEDLESGESLTVHIYTATNAGAKDTLVHTLTSPSSYTDGAVNLFTAPANATLDGDTDYLVVFEGGGNQGADFRIGLTNANAQDPGSLSTWSIEDARRRNDNLESDGASFMIAVNGRTGSPVSIPATLSDLQLSYGADYSVDLIPTFVADTTDYAADVGNLVQQVTLDFTAEDDSATVEILDATDTAITDAESTEDGHQIPLTVGANVVKVVVTTTSNTETYTVTVTRADVGVEISSVLVSNIGQTGDSVSTLLLGQGFRTGSHSDGYALNGVHIPLGSVSGTNIRARIFPTVASGQPNLDAPASEVIELEDPPAFVNDSVHFFAAPPSSRLNATTTYSLVLSDNSGDGAPNTEFGVTTEESEDAGAAAGWRISNQSYTWVFGSTWNAQINIIKISVSGYPLSPVPATGKPGISGVPQVDRTLTADMGDIADANGLPATFPGDYSLQWMRVDSDGVSNPVNIGADDDEYTLVDADAGKKIKLEVSFTDGSGAAETVTSDAYPLDPLGYPNATVAAAKGACPAGSDWCGTLTTGSQFQSSFGNVQTNTGLTTQYGALSPDTFTHGTTEYNVIRVYRHLLANADRSTIHNNRLEFQIDGFYLPDGTILDVDGTAFTVGSDSVNSTTGVELWDLKALGIPLDDWLDGQEVTVSLNLPPELLSANVAGNQLILEFSDELDPASPPALDSYLVKIDSNAGVNPTSVGYLGSTVTLTLPSAVTTDQSVTVSYTVPTLLPLKDLGGALVAAFTDVTVATNTVATGSPTISTTQHGQTRVGDTLAAAPGTIADANGLTSVSYSYQWLRVGTGGSETNITGATEQEYNLTAADQGLTVKVRADFTDDLGNAEFRISPASSTVAAAPSNSCAPGDVRLQGGADESEGEVQICRNNRWGFVCDDSWGRPDANLACKNAGYADGALPGSQGFTSGSTFISTDTVFFWLDDVECTGTDAALGKCGHSGWGVNDCRFSERAGARCAGVRTEMVSGTAATGAPDISGASQVGMTLTAGAGNIADNDGLPSGTFPTGYSFQWVRVDDADDSESDISGQTNRTYTPVTADIGDTFKVKVSFTDAQGNAEELTSGATWPVVPDAVPCPAGSVWCTVLTSGEESDEEGGSAGFSTGRGSLGAIGSLVDDTFTYSGTTYTVTDVTAGGTQSIFLGTEPDLPANGAGLTLHVQRLNGTLDLALADGNLIFQSGSGGNVWQFFGVTETGPSNPSLLRVTTRVNAPYTAKTDPGTRITVRLSAIPSNATGAPDITGAAQVGMTLTAGLGDLADADNLPANFPADYDIQWVRVSSNGSESDIAGETGPTYTPNSNDVAATLKVRLSYIDGGGGYEVATSEASSLVLPAAVSNCGASTVWCGTLTVGQGFDEENFVDSVGFDSVHYGSVSPTTFTHRGITYTVTALITAGTSDIFFATSPSLPSDGAGLVLHVQTFGGELELPLADVTLNDLNIWRFPFAALADNPTPLSDIALLRFYRPNDSFRSTTDADAEVAVRLSKTNTPATGMPSITGTTQVDSTLTVGTGGIVDADGKTRADNGDSGFAYSYQWIRVDGGNDIEIPGATTTGYTLENADAGKEIKVSVSFTDDEGNSEGPLVSDATGTVSSLGSNSAPDFDDGNAQERDFDESLGDTLESTPRAIGAPVSATDADNDSLTYSLGGADAASFDIDTGTGQLYTLPGENYDFEQKQSYSVTVTVSDGNVDVTASVTLFVIDNTNEQPSAPAAPLVEAALDSASRLDVSWAAPDVTGRPAITGYSLRYRVVNTTNWSNGPQDVSGTSAQVSFLQQDTEYEVQVRARNTDGNSEWSASGQGTTVTPPVPEVSFGSSSYNAIEGVAGAVVTVELSVPQATAITVPITLTEQGGATAADYSGVPASVTIAARATSARFTVTAAADSIDDDGESLLLGFGSLPAGIEAGAPAQTTVGLVADTGVETWYLFFEEAEYGVTEGGSVTVTVGLSNPWKPTENEALTIGLFTPELQGGARRADYSGVPESVTFQPGQTRVSFTITATDDSDDDDGESILLQFTRWNDDDLKTGRGPYPATVYLHDNDGLEEVRAFFGERNYTVREGGFTDIEVELDQPPGRSLTIPIEVLNNNGAGPNDYTIEALEATFTATQTSSYIEIEATDDNLNDDLEYLEIRFGELPDKVEEGSPNTTIVNLEDNDNGRINVTVRMDGGGPKHEGGGTFLFVYLDKEQEVDVVVPLVVEHLNGATEADYSGVPATVTIPAGELRDGVSIDVLEDSDDDDGEGIRVSFGDLPAGVRANPDRKAATYRFLDNDNVPQMTIQGDGAKEWPNPISYLKFIVTLDYIPEFEVSVDYATEDGTAVANQDYKPTSGTLTFGPGQRTKNLWVEVCSDGIDEDTERMTLRLSNPVRAEFRNGATASATGTISDYRGLGAKPCSTGIVIEDAEARELSAYDQDNEMTFNVRLNREAKQPVTVSYRTVNGTATAGQDYDAVSGVLRFDPGETEKTITVTVKADPHDDPGETFTLLLSNPQGAYLGDGEATGTIKNTGPMPGAWLSRFGRVAADQAVQSVGERIREGTRPREQNQFTLGGRRLDSLFDSFGNRRDAGGRRNGSVGGLPTQDGLYTNDGLFADNSLYTGDEDQPEVGYGIMGGGAVGADRPGKYSPGSRMQSTSAEIGAFGAPGVGGDASRQHLESLMRIGPEEINAQTGATPGGARGTWRPPTLRELAMGASFDYSRPSGKLGDDGEPAKPGWLGDWSAWGRTAQTRFSGADGPLSVNGDVATATMGFDSQWNRWIGGVALSYSEGWGDYNQRGIGGEVHSALTTLMPYASYSIDTRTSVWGTLGYGVGDLTLTPTGGEGIATDLTTMLAAFGGRGVMNARIAGLQLAWVSDAMLTETTSAKVANLNGAAGATGRLRLMLEGTGSIALAGGILRPRVEAGLRYDAGDAETGAGLEVGGGLAYASGRLSVEVNARGLTAHEDAAYEEWGYSSKVGYRPGDDGRGLSIDFGSSWGAAQSGVQSLWAQSDASGLVRNGPMNAAQRYQAQLGYGIGGELGFLRADSGKPAAALWLPYLRMETSSGSQAMTVGLKLTSGQTLDAGLEFGRRSAGINMPPEEAVMLQGQWQF